MHPCMAECCPFFGVLQPLQPAETHPCLLQAAAQPLCFLNIGVLREYLKHEFRDVLEPSSPVFAGNFDQDWGVNTYGDECLPPARQPAGGQGGKEKNNLRFEAILQDFVLLTFLVSLGALSGGIPELHKAGLWKTALDLDSLTVATLQCLVCMSAFY